MVHICNEILLSHKKEPIWVSSNDVDEPWTYDTEWSRVKQLYVVSKCENIQNINIENLASTFMYIHLIVWLSLYRFGLLFCAYFLAYLYMHFWKYIPNFLFITQKIKSCIHYLTSWFFHLMYPRISYPYTEIFFTIFNRAVWYFIIKIIIVYLMAAWIASNPLL